AGVQRPIDVEGGTLEVRVLEAPRQWILIALNHGPARVQARVTLAREAAGTGRDMARDVQVPLHHEPGRVRLSLDVAGGDVAAIVLDKR
ncbi:MAG TPA: hypothetical protein VKZ96_13725, partial [Thermomicrobiales bacterium]|nr:hypothetical protein [Thermomicrobiales bacterium]